MATKAIVGEKVGMTQVWDDQNRVVPVTVLQVAPCRVVHVKTPERDGYSALQVTFGQKKATKLTKPVAGQYAKSGVEPGVRLVELRLEDVSGYEVGQELKVDVLADGDRIDVTAVSKGKGFAGVMKRHGFSGQKASHGTHRVHRKPGAVGSCATPARVFQGQSHGRPHGRRQGDHAEPHRRAGRRGTEPAAHQGRGSRSEGRPRRHPRRGQAGSEGRSVMTSVDVLDPSGQKQGSVDLDATWFGIEPNVQVMHQVVTAQLAARRSGTQSTKTRAEVRGGGAKPWKQKGTGRARQGSIRSPQWRGGGVALGPKPRSYKQRTPKKMIRLALRSALSDRAAEGKVLVVDSWGWDVPRTKEALAALQALDIQGRVLVVLSTEDLAAWKSFRNLPAGRAARASRAERLRRAVQRRRHLHPRDPPERTRPPTPGHRGPRTGTRAKSSPRCEPEAAAPMNLRGRSAAQTR